MEKIMNNFWGGLVTGVTVLSLVVTLVINIIQFLERSDVQKNDVRIVEQHKE